jgi:single-stranded-DNA-specific exonuclease
MPKTHDQPDTHTDRHGSGSRPSLRGLTRRWLLMPDTTVGDPTRQTRPLLERILEARGISACASAEFLEPRLTALHDPGLLPGLEAAADRLQRAIQRGEPVAIYGDYDVDGITATAVLYRIIKHLRPDADLRTYVPHRMDEGYGLNEQALTDLARAGARLIVSVDCGITAAREAEVARSLGVDLIITDHHEPPAASASLPEAYAVVHPRLPGSRYPYPDLCGVGVAFKLAWRLATLLDGGGRVSEGTRRLLIDLLGIVALGTIADVAPLTGENRVLVRFGLHRVRQTSLVGLRALVEASRLDRAPVREDEVAFRLAPRLNAMGRMAHAAAAVELLITDDVVRARGIAEQLETANRERRATEQRIFHEATAMAVAAGMDRDDRRAIVLTRPDWHKGVVGIVCARLVERFGRPAVLAQTIGQECHGSGRSIDGFSLYAALQQCSEHLLSFGGHEMAAGVKLRLERFERFAEALTEIANGQIPADHLVPSLRVDSGAELQELTVAVVTSLESLAPFGRGNPPVSLLLRDAVIAGITPMGAGGDHLALVLRQGETWARCTAWGWGSRRELLRLGDTVDAVIRPQLSTYAGRTSVEPEIRDLRPVRRGAAQTVE